MFPECAPQVFPHRAVPPVAHVSPDAFAPLPLGHHRDLLEYLPVQSEELPRTAGMPPGTAGSDVLVSGGPRSPHPPPCPSGWEGGGSANAIQSRKETVVV